MALEHMENWSMYNDGGDMNLLSNGVYVEIGGFLGGNFLVADPDGVTAGRVMRYSGDAGTVTGITRYVLTGGSQVICGMAERIWLVNVPTADNDRPCPFQFRDASNNKIASVTINPTGGIRIYQGDIGGTLIAETIVPAVTANAWWHMEALFNTSTKVIEVRVEGVTKLTGTLTGTVPAVAQVTPYSKGLGGSVSVFYVKDMVIYDGTGSRNNTFLGGVVVYSLIPNADTTLGGWTLTGGASGHAVLANDPPQDDVQYLSAAFPVPAAMQYGLTDLPANVTTVRGLMSFVRAKKIDGGDGNLQNSLVSGASTGLGANNPITAAYTYWRDIFEVDPATSDSWTVNATNNVQLKLDRTV